MSFGIIQTKKLRLASEDAIAVEVEIGVLERIGVPNAVLASISAIQECKSAYGFDNSGSAQCVLGK